MDKRNQLGIKLTYIEFSIAALVQSMPRFIVRLLDIPHLLTLETFQLLTVLSKY